MIRALLAPLTQALWPQVAPKQPWRDRHWADRSHHAPALTGALIAIAILWSIVEAGYGLPFRQASKGALAAALRLSGALILDGAAIGFVAAALLTLGRVRVHRVLPRPTRLLAAGLLCFAAQLLVVGR